MKDFNTIFTQDRLDALLPESRSDQFFDALYGDASEGAYTIKLRFEAATDNQLMFNLELHQRPGKCLACNLTYGLPNVFARHPVVDINGLVTEIDQILESRALCKDWTIGVTREISRTLHVVPLTIDIQQP